jgi:hypothetical protein
MTLRLSIAITTGLMSITAAHAVTLKTFTEPQIGFEIAMPQACRHVTSPGTIEAVCAPDLDPAKSKQQAAAGGWLFEIDFEVTPKDAQPYSLAALIAEAPQMVCGESDATNVKITETRELQTADRTTFAAMVTCPALSFLGLPERTATARVVVADAKRFRLIARTPSADATRAAPATDAFLASFKLTNRQ